MPSPPLVGGPAPSVVGAEPVITTLRREEGLREMEQVAHHCASMPAIARPCADLSQGRASTYARSAPFTAACTGAGSSCRSQ